jgi:hypothetical protein
VGHWHIVCVLYQLFLQHWRIQSLILQKALFGSKGKNVGSTTCDTTPRNESLCRFEKSKKKGNVKYFFFLVLVYAVFMMYFVKIDQLRYPDMTTALQICYNINADWHTFFLEAIAFSFVLRVFSFKGLLSQWAGVIMCFSLPSQLCQISINSDQVSGKLKKDISSISSC